MESSRRRREWLGAGLAAALLGCVACNPGAGTGEVHGTLEIGSCHGGLDPMYELQPTFFSAEGTLEGTRDGLHIRIQRGSDVSDNSDGIYIDVQDVGDVYTQLQTMSLGAGDAGVADGGVAPAVTMPVSDPAAAGGVSLTLYLNGTCPAHIREIATVLPSVAGSGSVTFNAIYWPSNPSSTTAITGHFDDVVFLDPTDPTRRAMLSGTFDFTYNRGRPAQRYP